MWLRVWALDHCIDPKNNWLPFDFRVYCCQQEWSSHPYTDIKPLAPKNEKVEKRVDLRFETLMLQNDF